MSFNFLDKTGLSYVISKIKEKVHGLPSGGTSNQVLAKNSNTDYDTKWASAAVIDDSSTTEDNVWSASKTNDEIAKKPDFPVSISNGGTGATTAAAARANLATPAMITESYPTLLPINGSNNWIKVGTSNSSYGLLPSASGVHGSGHNYLGTSSWYWKHLYVENINGVAVGTSPKFTDTNTWPTKYSQLTDDRQTMTGYYISGQYWPGHTGSVSANANGALMTSFGGPTVWWGTSNWSDIRIKKNLKQSSVKALDILCSLPSMEFDYINEQYGKHTKLGYIAQDIEKYIPEAINAVPKETQKDEGVDVKTIDYQRVVPYLIKAIQEQQEQINELKEMIK